MLPVEILEDIFAFLSRDDLDHCEIICLKWSKLTETRKIGHDIMLKRLHDMLTKYIDADEIIMCFNQRNDFLLNKELWKYFDFGKKTEINFLFYTINPTNDSFKNTFKEFISGKHMEHPKLNKLDIYFDEIDRHVMFHLIVEAFCNTDEPLKFFKSITTYPSENFDEIFGEFGFVCEDRNPQKYRLSHPKLKWALEATQHLHKCIFQLTFKPVEL